MKMNFENYSVSDLEKKLSELEISDNSFKDVHSLYKLILPFLPCGSLTCLSDSCSSLTIQSDFDSLCKLDISGYNNLKTIKIVESAMNSVRVFVVSNNLSLQELIIKQQSLIFCRKVNLTSILLSLLFIKIFLF